MKSLGEAATELPWLSPCARSLMVLARSRLSVAWGRLRADPGVALLAARAWADGPVSFLPQSCDVKVLRSAERYLRLHATAGFVDWAHPGCRVVYAASLRQARLALTLAEQLPGCDPVRAWVGGLLASLGWLAVCTVDPVRSQHSLAAAPGPGPCWQFDPAAVARRLSRRWRLPAWLTTVAGHLGLPLELAARLGADSLVFQVVQLAVLLRQRIDRVPPLAVGADCSELLAALHLDVEKVEKIAHEVSPSAELKGVWQPPANQPLLPELLRLACRNRRRDDQVGLARLHQDIDHLQEALEARRAEESRRLQVLKLGALAEFAAGAGHEINNPLAVISGQAQFLLRRLQVLDGPAEEIDNPAEYLANLKQQLVPSLQKIVGQTQRIHGILTGLMQFARPPAPKPETVAVDAIMRETAAELQNLADERGVRLVCVAPPSAAQIQVDPDQTRASLSALLRNAIEAAPVGGWAGMRVEQPDEERLVLVVEDTGPGPGPLAREHLFDPFFSGRSAGRGRGMGLPTAWRLACQQGGDLRYDGSHGEVTRFSLILPAATACSVLASSNGHNGTSHPEP
jgi:signal transduction histidine kinase